MTTQYPIQGLNPSEVDKRKVTDKTNELARHVSVVPDIRAVFTNLVYSGTSWLTVIFFQFSVRAPCKMLPSTDISLDVVAAGEFETQYNLWLNGNYQGPNPTIHTIHNGVGDKDSEEGLCAATGGRCKARCGRSPAVTKTVCRITTVEVVRIS